MPIGGIGQNRPQSVRTAHSTGQFQRLAGGGDDPSRPPNRPGRSASDKAVFSVCPRHRAEVFELRRARIFSLSAFVVRSSRTRSRAAAKRDYPDSDQKQRKNPVPCGHGQAKKAPDDFVAKNDGLSSAEVKQIRSRRHLQRGRRTCFQPFPPFVFDACVVKSDRSARGSRERSRPSKLRNSEYQDRRADRDRCRVRPALPNAQLARSQAAQILKSQRGDKQEGGAGRGCDDQMTRVHISSIARYDPTRRMAARVSRSPSLASMNSLTGSPNRQRSAAIMKNRAPRAMMLEITNT